jgi:DNA polymerase-3 subunit delta'
MWQVYGQDHIIRQLGAGLKTGRLAHAYLLVGPPHVGKMALALNLAQAVNCLGSRSGTGIAAAGIAAAGIEAVEMGGPEMDGGLFGGAQDGLPAAAANSAPDSLAGGLPAGVPVDAPCGNCIQCRRIAEGLHADLKVIGVGIGEEEGQSRRDIRIDQIREIESFLNLTAYEGSYKVVILDGAELLNTAAANALLKTLEEPPVNVLLLLLTSNEDALLSTIKSRCRFLYLKPVAKSELADKLVAGYAAAPEMAEQLARLSRGCLGQAVNALRDGQILEQREADLERLEEVCEGGLDARFNYAAELAARFNRDRDATRELLYLWLRWWRDLLLIKEGAEQYVHNADRIIPLRLQATRLTTAQVVAFIKRLNLTLEALDRNANARLALEVLMLNLP